MRQDLITIIVPIYKVEGQLSKCIDSIINQTYKNLEIILVDDGSPDNCPIICDWYAEQDKRIKVIHQENRGVSASRNTGIETATGEYLAFIDSDDHIKPEMIEKLYQNLIETESDISFCNFYKEFSNKTEIRLKNTENKTFIGKEKIALLCNNYAKIIMVSWNKLYKKEVFKHLRFPKGKIMEDSYIILDILNNIKQISYLKEPLYYYVQRQGSIMHNFNLKHLDIIEVYEKRIEFCSKNGYEDLLADIKKTYVYNLVLKIMPGLYYIKEKDQLRKIATKVKKLSKEIRNSKTLTKKETIKFYLFSYFPITYVKIKILWKGV